jgi:hypothetical protein
MAFVMGAAMAVIMQGFMLNMLDNKGANLGVLGVNAVVFALALWLVRRQVTAGDVSWMKAMIPHYSIAILTSERAHITDRRPRKLADGIIETQRREIAEMKSLISDLEARRQRRSINPAPGARCTWRLSESNPRFPRKGSFTGTQWESGREARPSHSRSQG